MEDFIRQFIAIYCFFLGLSACLFAQFPNIILDKGGIGYQPCEPSIAINQKNPDNIVAGAILDKLYYTLDGGKTWEKKTLTSPYGVFGDPCVVSDAKGRIYYLHLSNPTKGGWNDENLLDRIVCQRIKKGGAKWTEGGYMGFHHPKDQDKEWMIANPRNNHLYAAWTQFDKYGSKDIADRSNILFSRSENKSKTWSDAVRVNEKVGDCLDDDDTAEGAVPAVGPNGEVYLAWALKRKLYFDKSFDEGRTWMEVDVEVGNQPGGWTFDIPGINRSNGLPVLVCDVSDGPYRGNLYLNWADQRNGEDDTDIWISRSTDGGETWSEALRINDDGPGNQQFFTWMTIDQTTGYVYAVFYDRRGLEGNATDVYLAYSTDGGEHFKNVKISETHFTPNKAVFIGDYNHISAHGGRICPIWTRMDGGVTSVVTTVIEHRELEKLDVP